MEGRCRLSGDTRGLAWSSNFIADADIRHDEIDRTRYPFGVYFVAMTVVTKMGRFVSGYPTLCPGSGNLRSAERM